MEEGKKGKQNKRKEEGCGGEQKEIENTMKRKGVKQRKKESSGWEEEE